MKIKEMNALQGSAWSREMFLQKLEHLNRIEASLQPLCKLSEDKEWAMATMLAVSDQKIETYRTYRAHKARADKLYAIIEAAPDAQMRNILTYRYLQRMSWDRVAAKLGGGNTADAVKNRVQRYLATVEPNDNEL